MDIPERFRKKLEEFTFSDYYGLISPGLTCYLNSVLQVLFMTEDFSKAVKRCCKDEASLLEKHLHHLFTDLRKSEAQTNNVVDALGIVNIYEQRDAAEYFEKILRLTSVEAAKMFRGKLKYTTTCMSCEEAIHCNSLFWTLPLVVEHSTKDSSVEQGLKAFFEGQKMCGDNQMTCSRCNERQDAVCQCEMTKPPDILTLLLKRFSFDSKCGSFIKLHTEVTVPQTLHVNSRAYDLYATINHYGTLKCGHYVAQIKSYETQAWYLFDDGVVKKMKSQPFKDGATYLTCSSAYLLMYRTVNKHSGSAGLWKTPCQDVPASCNQGETQKAVVAEKKHESFNREEDCCVWEPAGKLAESANWPRYKVTPGGNKSHVAPPCDGSQEPRDGTHRRCELPRKSAVPPTGCSRRSGSTAAGQSRTQRQEERRSSPARTKTRRRLKDAPKDRKNSCRDAK